MALPYRVRQPDRIEMMVKETAKLLGVAHGVQGLFVAAERCGGLLLVDRHGGAPAPGI